MLVAEQGPSLSAPVVSPVAMSGRVIDQGWAKCGPQAKCGLPGYTDLSNTYHPQWKKEALFAALYCLTE